MQGAAPLLKAVHGVFEQSRSRIPHLELHIHRHQAQSLLRARPARNSRAKPQRLLHSLATLDGLTYHDDTHSSIRDDDRPAAVSWPSPESNTPVQKASNLFGILQEGHPERVFFALTGQKDKQGAEAFVRDADEETFAQAIRALDPDYFVEPYKQIYRFMKVSVTNDPTYRWVRPLSDRLRSFMNRVDTIVALRREAGHGLTLETYRHLLRCAKACGYKEVAAHILHTLMPEDGVTPDLECYNHYLEALNWAHAAEDKERFQLRVTPRNLDLRKRSKRPSGLEGHRVASASNRKDTIRYTALMIFKELVSRGLQGDEATFTNLMIAMGREGDLDGARSILKSVWNVDVDLLAQYDEEEIESPTFYELDSPLRPSERLLFAVVHVFGSNNDVGLASSLLDYISRNYNLPIPDRVWMHLFEWASVLSLRRSGAQKRQGQDIGQISRKVPMHIYEVMRDEPHNVQPRIALLTLSARIQRDQRVQDKAFDYMREAVQLLDEDRTTLSITTDELVALIRESPADLLQDGFMSPDFLHVRRKFILASLELDCNLQLMITCFRNLFKQADWAGSGKEREWSHRQLPDLINEFLTFLPNVLEYPTPTGRVQLTGKIHRNVAIRQAHGDQMRKAGMLRAYLDTNDHGRLVNNIQRLPALLDRADHFCFICETFDHGLDDCPHKDRHLAGEDDVTWIHRDGSDHELAVLRERREPEIKRVGQVRHRVHSHRG